MKRNTILATLGALSMLAVPAMAQDKDHVDRDQYTDDIPLDDEREFRRRGMKPPVPGYGPGSVDDHKKDKPARGFDRRLDRRFDDDAGWSSSRMSRRAKSRQRILGRWNHRFLDHAAVRAELRLHARRTARLARMERIARRSGKRGLVIRIRAAVRRENVRHDRAMSRLEGSFGYRGRGRF